MQIKDRVFAVTGGGNGIGREVVLELIRRGGRVAAVDLSEAGLAETVALAKAPEKRVSALAEGSFWCAKNLAAHGKKEAAISLYGFVRQANVPKYIAAAAARNLVLLQGQDGAALLGEMVRSNEQEMLNAALLAEIGRAHV